MQFSRPIMWNVPHGAEIVLYALIPLLLIVVAAGLIWRVRKWRLGTPDSDDAAPEGGIRGMKSRWREVAKTAFFQSRLATDPFAAVMHQAIFWGMVVLFLGTAVATVDQDVTNLFFDAQILQGKFYLVYELVLDVFGVVLIVGIGMAVYRRLVLRPAHFRPPGTQVSWWDRFPLLTGLLLVALTGFLVEGLRIAEGQRIESRLAAAGTLEARSRVLAEMGLRQRMRMGPERQDVQLSRIAAGSPVFPAAAWAPVGNAVGRLFAAMPERALQLTHQVAWWAHALLAFGLIVAIPFTKLFHAVSSPVHLALRVPRPPGRLPVTCETGARSVRDLTWRQLLQVDACTWCGKCEQACPSHATAAPLSPRDVVQNVASALLRTPLKRNGSAAGGDLQVAAEAVWSCYTCRACEDVCPVHVEQPRLLVDLRRQLVDQGEVDEGLQTALKNLQRYGNSFGTSPKKRAEWTKELSFALKDARKEPVEYLWLVGDYASYDQRVQQVTRKLAGVWHAIGLDVGLLFEKEQNAGNDVRRVGEEGLFSLLRERNEKELSAARFHTILTTDPHTYNTLKNEYEQLAGGQQSNGQGQAATRVLHYTELLDEVIRRGDLRLDRALDYPVTYHDPCYLGRFNDVYEAPRRILQALGVKLVEMPRNRRNSFCCGAGGGRIWMKDMPSGAERPAEIRVREALGLPGVGCLIVACPKDYVMFQDAVRTVGAESRLRIADIAELVCEALTGDEAATNEREKQTVK